MVPLVLELTPGADSYSAHREALSPQLAAWESRRRTVVPQSYLPDAWLNRAERYRDEVRASIRNRDPVDTGIFAYHGPNARVLPGRWADARFRRLHVVRFTGPMYSSTQPIWTDGVFPNRLPFELLETVENPASVRLSADTLEALRLSANTGGVPQPVAVNTVDVVEEPEPDDLDADLDDRTLGIEGDLDEVVRAVARREQRAIRRRKFGSRLVLTCDLCGRQWPRRFMTAAHIKRRRDADDTERRDLNNIMAACPECDLMFEWGHITVGANGRVRVEPDPATGDLAKRLNELQGRRFPGFDRSVRYFAWHEAYRFRQTD